jgi:hypothetical protein
MTPVPTALFLDRELGDFLSEKKRAMLDAIDKLDREALFKANPDAQVGPIVAPYEVEPLRVQEEKITWDKEEVVPKPAMPKSPPATRVQFFVPFTGTADLFKCYPLTRSVNERVSADVYGPDGEIALTYELDDPIPAKFRARFDRDLAIIRFWLEQIEPVIRAHNESLRPAALEQLVSRRRLLMERDWEAELGFPRRQTKPPSRR